MTVQTDEFTVVSVSRPSRSPVTLADPATAAADALMLMLGRLRRRLRSMRDDGGLSPSQSAVLGRLDRHGPTSASELAAAEQVRPQSMAATVRVLLELGLVRRDPDPTDGRRQVLSLSADGLERLTHSRRVREDWLVATLRERLDADELARVVEAIALVERATLAEDTA